MPVRIIWYVPTDGREGMAQRFPADCSNANIREIVSGTTCNLPGLCCTVKS